MAVKSMHEGDAVLERMMGGEEKKEEAVMDEEAISSRVLREVDLGREKLQEKMEKGKRGSMEEFMKEVMEAVRLTRQPTPWMVQREKLVRMMKHDMERVSARPGSFVAESLRYNQNLARAYLRFRLQSCPPREELAVRENRMLRRKMMMLSQEE